MTVQVVLVSNVPWRAGIQLNDILWLHYASECNDYKLVSPKHFLGGGSMPPDSLKDENLGLRPSQWRPLMR